MNEIILQVSTLEKSSGTNTNYSFNPFLLPSNFKLGDVVELELTDYYFNYNTNTQTEDVDMGVEMNANGLQLEQIIIGPNYNSSWVHINIHRNHGNWMFRTFFDTVKYKCVLTDEYLQFNFRTVNLIREQINDNNMGDQFIHLKLKKIN